MAHDTLYVNPSIAGTAEKQNYIFDFSDDLTGDTALYDIGSGSTISAFKYDGTDVSSTILSSKTRTNMLLSVDIGSVTEGEEYRVEFLGKGSTTNRIYIKVLEVRARKFIQGGF
jgi:hypothetical protein